MPTDKSRETPRQVQRSTFYLLGCERCGQFWPPPARFESVARTEPMRCRDCGELLLLAECFIAPHAEPHQERGPGDTIRYVAYPDRLPDSPGRQIWTTQ